MAVRNTLSALVIGEISLVDDPANEDARVVLMKMKSGSGGNPDDDEAAAFAAAKLKEQDMDIETLSKALEDAEAKLALFEKSVSDATAALKTAEDLAKSRGDEIEVLTKKLADASTEAGEDPVFKGMTPAARKRLEDAEAAIVKMRTESEEREAIEKARTLGVADPDKVGPLMQRIAKGKTTADDVTAFEGILKAHAAVLKDSKLFKKLGSDDQGDGAVEDVIKSKADEIKKADPKLTDAQAYSRAMEQNPGLYAEYMAAKKAA